MKKDRRRLYARIFKVIWVASVAFVVYLSLTSNLVVTIKIKNIDKAYHALAYLWLAALPFAGFQRLKIALTGAVFMIPLGVALEFAQELFTRGRVFSVADMAANTTGVILGIVLGFYLNGRVFRTTRPADEP